MTLGHASFTLESVAWDDPRGVALRRLMDVDLQARYGDIPSSRDAHGPDQAAETARDADSVALLRALSVDAADVVATVLALDADGEPLGHAALRILRDDWEVKRVIVTAEARGRGVGRALMVELESIARAAGRPRLILHTGNRQPEAVRLYTRLGWTPIATYEPYATAMPEVSLCFERLLT